ncbi:MAG: VOC family protein [Acidobacteriota bacterium]
MNPPFHLAFPVRDLESTRRFYGEILGCRLGRSAETWIDFELYGHQISAHVREGQGDAIAFRNPVDGHGVPIPHFGVVLPWDAWQELGERLRAPELADEVEFLIEPTVRFAGQTGEQGTFFVRDPSGNALEFKSFQNPEKLFATS